MINKRTAIIALFTAVGPKFKAQAEEGAPSATWYRPPIWTINLDQMARLEVHMVGEVVTLMPAEIFAALKQS